MNSCSNTIGQCAMAPMLLAPANGIPKAHLLKSPTATKLARRLNKNFGIATPKATASTNTISQAIRSQCPHHRMRSGRLTARHYRTNQRWSLAARPPTSQHHPTTPTQRIHSQRVRDCLFRRQHPAATQLKTKFPPDNARAVCRTKMLITGLSSHCCRAPSDATMNVALAIRASPRHTSHTD